MAVAKKRGWAASIYKSPEYNYYNNIHSMVFVILIMHSYKCPYGWGNVIVYINCSNEIM